MTRSSFLLFLFTLSYNIIVCYSSYTGHRVYKMSQTLNPYFKTTSHQFQNHLMARKPYLSRYGTLQALDQAMGWNTARWGSEKYLTDVVGPNTKVRVEQINALENSNMFGPKESKLIWLKWKTFMKWYHSKESALPSFLPPFFFVDPLYYLTIQGESVHPPLEQLFDAADITLPSPLKSLKKDLLWDSAHMWIGKVQSKFGLATRMHADTYDNLYYLISGKKKVILIGPNDASKLSLYGKFKTVKQDGEIIFYNQTTAQNNVGNKEVINHFSEIDPHLKLEEIVLKYPDYATIDGSYEVDMIPGDVLYIPTGWFHSFQSYGKHMAVNFWFLHRKFVKNGGGVNDEADQKDKDVEKKKNGKPRGVLSTEL